MRIAQVIFDDASQYERKCQRVDHAALAARHAVHLVPIEEVRSGAFDVAHLYAGPALSPAAFADFGVPCVSSAPMKSTRWSWGRWRRPAKPGFVVSPLGSEQEEIELLPEAVEEHYFGAGERTAADRDIRTVGSFRRAALSDFIEQVVARIQRVRSDVVWKVLSGVPSPGDLARLDLWIDPAFAPDDFDGFTAEAVTAGIPVVATRTPINALRLEKGRTGALVPPRDPNEMTHAILTALFKPEAARIRAEAGRQTASKFRPKQRLRILTHMYETLTA